MNGADAMSRARPVLVQGTRSRGRLDPVSGLLAALRRSGVPVVHLDPAQPVPAALLQRYRPPLLVRVGPAARVEDAEQDLLGGHGVTTVAWRPAGDAGPAGEHGAGGVGGPGAEDLPLRLPVGVDRAVAAEVLPPGPQHDVLLVGHATDRPDLYALARGVLGDAAAAGRRAATVGAGWPRGWAGDPDGARLVQLLRGAPVHVHTGSARTALLGVASGGLPAVPAGGDVTGLLADVPGVARFTGTADLVATLHELLADPETLRVAAAAARDAVLDRHGYERRWEQLLAALADRGLPVPGPASAERRVVVSGWYGAGNLGDELIVRTLADRVETAVPGARVVVAGRHPAVVTATHGLEAFARADRRAAEEEAGRATAVLLGGGGLWEDYTFARNGGVAGLVTDATASPSSLAVLPLLAAVHGRPVHVVGVGAGPLTDPGARAVVRFTADLADTVTVRDPASRDLLTGIDGWSADVDLAPDLVHALPLEDAGDRPATRVPAGPGPVIAVNLRTWPEHEDTVADAVVTALDRLAAEHGARVVGLPLDPTDTARLAAVLARTRAEHVVLAHTADPRQLGADLSACDAVVAMRLHGCLLAHRAGVPVVGIGYDPKVAAHFAEVGRSDFVVDLAGSGDRLAERVGACLRDGLPGPARAALADLTRQATDWLDRLCARLTSTDPPVEPVRPLPWLDDAVAGALTLHPTPADVTGTSTLRADRRPPVRAALLEDDLVLGLVESAPQAGDVAAWRAVVPAAGSGNGRRVRLRLHSPYPEKPDMAGRLAWQVLAGDRVLLSEDVAGWSEPVDAWLGWGPAAGDVPVTVRLVALTDCEDARWGRAASIVLSPLTVRAWTAGAALEPGRWVASCSAPTTRVLA